MEKKKWQFIENRDFSNTICVFQKEINLPYHCFKEKNTLLLNIRRRSHEISNLFHK